MLKQLILQATQILEESQPTEERLAEVENALSAYLEAIATDRITEPVEFSELEHANRLLREVRRARSRRIAESQASTEDPTASTPDGDGQVVQDVNVSPHLGEDDTYDPLKKFLSSTHDPEAEALMDSAEEAFYGGNYQKAIPLYENVLRIEPSWSRAQQHRDEAEDFMRTGNIPSVALPPEAGKAYGKAQSAARVFRYQTALAYLDEAFESLNEAGIQRWREGESLRQDLENQMQAHEVYEEGLSLLRQGDLSGALSKVQTAATAVSLPEYVDKANEIRQDLAAINEIGDVVNLGGNIPPDKLGDARNRLDHLSIKYGEIPSISRLRNRMDIVLPAVVTNLTESIRRHKRQGDAASTIKNANDSYARAGEDLLLLQNLQPDTATNLSLQQEIRDASQAIEEQEDSLQRANQALNSENRFFPRNAYLISSSVRNRFPQDPKVIDLKRRLRWYYVTLYGGGAIGVILIIGMLILGGRGIANTVRERQLARTPSATPTASITPTGTITPTPTITPTSTPESTATPDYTATPTPVISGTVKRTLWARKGCYESEQATGRIVEGGVVTLIALPQRVFDDLNRECVLVEYRTPDDAVIGYVLLADLSIP